MQGFRPMCLAVTALAIAGCSGDGLLGPASMESPDATVASSLSPAAMTYSGEAYVANVSALGLNVRLAWTGPLPSDGGTRTSSLLTVGVGNILGAGIAGASTVGGGSGTTSHASIADVDLSVAGIGLKAGLVIASARAECRSGEAEAWGGSIITGLVINGKKIIVGSQPNQVIRVGWLAKVHLNEQVKTAGGIRVNAIRISVLFAADVVIASAQAGVTCAPVCPPLTGDYVTGAGTFAIQPGLPDPVFDITAGQLGNEVFGELVYDGRDVSIRSTSITEYIILNPLERLIRGTGTINGQATTFEVLVLDWMDPSKRDRFLIRTATGYEKTGLLTSGDIEIHPETGGCPD